MATDNERRGGEVAPGGYMFVDRAGCTLFVPKSRDPERVAAILRRAVEWWEWWEWWDRPADLPTRLEAP